VIALLHGLRAYGAAEHYVEAIARRLGEEAVLIHLDDPVLDPLRRLGARTIPIRPASAPSLAFELTMLLRRLRPRVAHVTEVWPPALVAGRLARVPRVIVTHHTPELPRRDNLHGRLWSRLGWATRPEVVYTSEADRLSDRRRPSHVVPLGIDLDRFEAGTPALERNGPIIGNVARLAPQKGQRYLIEAAPAVLARHPEARFVVVGDGELRAELERQAAPLGDRMVFTGARHDVPDLLASFDVFAFPSLYEGLCVAVIEAQAAGVPVVATPVGGIRETVVDGETGFLCPPRDPAALSERIIACLDQPGQARKMAETARRRVRERFSEQRMVEETLALYEGTR
jgi:glycosyltransferase involved in cell wall biosynthesis